MAGIITKTGVALIAMTMSQAAFAETKSYDVDSFSGVKASTGVSVEISVGGAQSISAEGPDGKMDKLEIINKDGILHIRHAHKSKGWSWGASAEEFHVTITMPDLVLVDVSTGAEVSASGVDSERFTIDASSGAGVEISGNCGSVSADASSGSSIDARDLVCNIGVADVSSGASIELHATEKFSGDASSGGSITVSGNPTEVTSNKSSGGSIRIR